MKRFLSWLALDHRSLGHQPLFWVAIFLPVTLFLFFGCLSWIGSSPQWNYQGFNRFIDISKLPLGLLALALPFTALVTSWHRSIQNEKEIYEIQRKANFDMHLTHRNFFIEKISKSQLNHELTYSSIFPGSTPLSYDPTPSISLLETINQDIKDITSKLRIIKILISPDDLKPGTLMHIAYADSPREDLQNHIKDSLSNARSLYIKLTGDIALIDFQLSSLEDLRSLTQSIKPIVSAISSLSLSQNKEYIFYSLRNNTKKMESALNDLPQNLQDSSDQSLHEEQLTLTT